MSERNDVPKRSSIRVLLLEDNPADAELSLRQLRRDGFEVEADVVRTADEFKERINSGTYDIVLGDYRLPGWTGMDAVQWLRAEGHELPFILVSGTFGDDFAVECIKLGVTDYVIKDRLERLPVAVRRALYEEELRRQRAQTERDLRESEKQYRLLFEINPHPMCVFDAQSLDFLEVNEAATLHYGYSRSEFLSMTIRDIRTAEDIPAVRQSVSLRTPGHHDSEIRRHRKKDGTVIDVEITSYELSFYGRQAVLSQALDITERRQNEERLRQSEERFSKAFRSSPLPITISTRREGRYVDANEAFQVMVGLRSEEIVGHTVNELNVWAFPEDRTKMVEALDRDGRVSALETVFNSRTNGERRVQVSAEPIQLNGIPCVLAITNDVTEAEHMAAQFRQAQKMEAIGRLAGGVAHDFNNLLGVIIGYSDISLDLVAPEGPVTKHLEQIKKASQRAASLTLQLLAFSRQQIVFPKNLDLNEVVRNASDMLQRMVGEDVPISFQPTIPIGIIHADAGQIEQILMNLVVNARDAMPSGGQIIIETGDAELDEAYVSRHPGSRAGQHVVLTVSDTGCGMDENTKSKIFEPFFTTKPVGKGTGLGLSTVYGIVKQNAGTVFVYSEPGKGTTFKIYFPRMAAKAEPLLPPQEAMLSEGSETILVVEDDAPLRELAIRILQDAGYQVIEAKDAESALDIVRTSEQGIDLVLTDVIMPGKTGVELLEQAKLVRPNLRLLLMSGYAGDLVALRGGVMPQCTLLEKPFTRSSLLKKVYAVLHRESAEP